MTFIVFLYEFHFKEVICDGHTLSVKCCNNQHFIHSLLFMDSLLLSRQERFCEANQLHVIAHQTMKSYMSCLRKTLKWQCGYKQSIATNDMQWHLNYSLL